MADDPRVEPDLSADERTTLVQFLDYFRATLAWKVAGLDDAAAASRSCPPSSLSLTGLVRHLGDVERHWFRRIFEGADAPARHWTTEHPDGDFDLVDSTTSLADALAEWQSEVDHARSVVDATASLDQLAAVEDWNRRVSLRWILVHLVEEYARHCGHADLLRERIDGQTGD